MALRPGVFFAFLAACSPAALTPRLAAGQHITVDGRFSPAQTLVGPNYSVGAGLCKQVGSNLFHSFGQFGLSTGESAAFSGPATVNNVIGRVTGGNLSSIDGRIQSNIAGANLYLINPSGIVFGPHATVNVSGSFHASTADYVKMSDGAKFQATNPDASTLSAAPPAAFGFLTPKPAAISVNGSSLGPVPGTLGLVAGPVSINSAANLTAPGGTIHVTSAAGAGEVPVDPRNTPALTVGNFGSVDIKGGSKLDVGNPGVLGTGGSVFIHAGALTIDASEIGADNYGSGSGGVIALRGETQIVLSNGSSVHAFALGSGSGAGISLLTARPGAISADASLVLSGSTGSGSAGPLAASTGQLTLTNGGQLASITQGTGNGKPVTVSADNILVDGTANPKALTAIGSVTTGRGTASDVTISAGTLTILANGEIVSLTAGPGSSGNVSLSAPGAVSIDGTSTNFQAGILSQANFGSSGNAGSVQVIAGSLSLVNTAQVSASTFGLGAGGDVNVQVGSKLSINGSGSSLVTTGIQALTFLPGAKNAGNITVNAGDLSIVTNGEIASFTSGSGNAGNVSVRVGGMLFIDGTSATKLTGIASNNTSSLSTGTAGNVSVDAGTLKIVTNGQIASGTFGTGNAGSLSVNVAGALTIDGVNANANFRTGITTDAESGSKGNAGSVSVAAANLSVINGGTISSDALGLGPANAGDVSVSAGALRLTNFGGISSDTVGRGNGGSVTISAGTLSIGPDGQITTDTLGAGRGGSIAVNVTGALTIDGASAIGPTTGITALTFRDSTGSAGNITVTAGSLSITPNGQITTDTFGTGKGGNIAVTVSGRCRSTAPPRPFRPALPR